MDAFCARWGCILPVGEGSTFGFGPVCEVCRYGLRSSAIPELEFKTLSGRGGVLDYDFQREAYLATHPERGNR